MLLRLINCIGLKGMFKYLTIVVRNIYQQTSCLLVLALVEDELLLEKYILKMEKIISTHLPPNTFPSMPGIALVTPTGLLVK